MADPARITHCRHRRRSHAGRLRPGHRSRPASTDVDSKTNEITRFQPLLDQIGDLRDTVTTADALRCQREHVDYLAERGAHWTLIAKGNQPSLHAQLAGLPWHAVPDATRDDRGHGRREMLVTGMPTRRVTSTRCPRSRLPRPRVRCPGRSR